MKKLPKLLPFQEKGVRKLIHFNGRTLLADEQGLGKTITSLYYQVRYGTGWPIVVVCPAIAKYVWDNEAREHFGIPTVLLSRNVPPPPGQLPHGKIYVINYEILGGQKGQKYTWIDALRALKPKLIIIDESQRIKSPDAKCTKAVYKLCKDIDKVLCLSGTPMPNGRPFELWSTVSLLRPEVFNNRWDYCWRYCGPQKGFGGHWTFTGATNLEELNQKLNQYCMIRRRKEDVLKELPPKTTTLVPVTIEMKEYHEAEADLIRWLVKNNQKAKAKRAATALRMVKVGYLLRLAAKLKKQRVIEWIREYLSSNKDNKLIVFGVQREFLDDLHKAFITQSVLVNGSTPKQERKTRTTKFNEDSKCRLLFGNIISAGTAWSCRSTSTMLFTELVWTPGDIMQAEDRIRGVGRGLKGAHADIYFMLARNTIEEKLWKVLKTKEAGISQGVDGIPSVMTGTDVYRIVEKELLDQ